jgi:hypothetical protein
MGLRKLLVLLALFLTGVAAAEPFVREDWVYGVEASAPDKFGVNHWGLQSFPLPLRAVQRGKHSAENAYFDNFRFQSHPAVGGGLRFFSTMVDFGLFSGLQNFDHVLGHDARARELSRDYPGTYRFVSRRFTQTLPVFLGGRELDDSEKATFFPIGADAKTLDNSSLSEMRNQFVYDLERTALTQDEVNRAEISNLIFHRLSTLQLSWEEPIPACVAAYGQQNQPFQCRGGSGEARDYSNYLTDLNTGRYGVATRDNYRVTTADLQRANRLQFVDPIFLVALWRYGSDYVVDGKNTTRLPMIPLGTTGVSYLPGLRIDLSPFGIEYIQDNFIRYGGSLTNLFWTRGDDKYERRLGAGFDVTGVPLFAGATGGAFGELYKQPLLSRVDRAGPLTAAEFGVLHNAWNAGLTLRAPLFSFGSDSKDPMRVIMTLTVGRKNTGWIPGEYIKGSTYAETGLGLRL